MDDNLLNDMNLVKNNTDSTKNMQNDINHYIFINDNDKTNQESRRKKKVY